MTRKMVVLCAIAATAAAVCLAGPQGLVEKLTQAKQAVEKGDYGKALALIDIAKVIAFEKAPLSLENFQLVKTPGSAYGVYQPRGSNVYKQGEEIYVYCEPSGYTFKKKDGLYAFSISVDFSVLDTAGKILAGQKDFGRFGFQSHRPNTEFMLNLTYTLTGAAPGKYVFETTVKDDNSSKRAVKTVEIEIK